NQARTASLIAGMTIASHASSAPPPLSGSSSRSWARASSIVTSSSIGHLHRLRQVDTVAAVFPVAALARGQNPVLAVFEARLRLRVALGNPQRAIVRHRNPGLSHLAFTPEPRVPHVWQHEFSRTIAIGKRD